MSNLPTPVGIVLIADVIGAGIRKLPARTGIARSLPVQSVLPSEPPSPPVGIARKTPARTGSVAEPPGPWGSLGWRQWEIRLD